MQTKWPSTRINLIGRIASSADDEAWRTFIELYRPLVFRYCRKRGLQDADAQDVAQNVFANVSRAIAKFSYQSDRGRFRCWLGTVTFREMRRYLQLAERAGRGVGGESDRLGENLPASYDSIWRDEFNAHIYELAKQRVRPRFEEATWQAFDLTWEQDKEPGDVAQQMNRTNAWVYKAKFKILQRLREEVEYLAGGEIALGDGNAGPSSQGGT